MTHARLVKELGVGELAYQVAYDEMETAARSEQTERARKLAGSLHKFDRR